MTKQSLIPVGAERAVTRRETSPFAFLQHEIDRLFEGFARNSRHSPPRLQLCGAWT
jgi:HSP20 family protein